jgi:hypothetical protein
VKTFDRDEVLAFLAEIDEMLAEPAAMEIIGGAAALLAYGAHSATKDIDSLANIDERIQQAARRTTRTIPLDRAAIADPPYNYEDRRRSLDLPFRKLTIWVPERHDLLLMKAVRAQRHDVDVIEEMHEAQPFDLDTLVERFDNEMGQAMIDPRQFELQFLYIVERLFGAKSAQHVGAKGRPKMTRRGSDKL